MLLACKHNSTRAQTQIPVKHTSELITSGIFAKIIFDLPITIHTKDLVKTYSSRTVVNHVSIDVKQGEIVGLLGPNGAGKTTTFYMVVGLIRPDEGQVFLDTQEITALILRLAPGEQWPCG